MIKRPVVRKVPVGATEFDCEYLHGGKMDAHYVRCEEGVFCAACGELTCLEHSQRVTGKGPYTRICAHCV